MTERRFPRFRKRDTQDAQRSRIELTLPPLSLLHRVPTAAAQQPATNAAAYDPSVKGTDIGLVVAGAGSARAQRESEWEADLGMAELVMAISEDRRYSGFIRQTLAALDTDAEDIAWRQAVFGDFFENPALCDAIRVLLPNFGSLRHTSGQLGQRRRSLLMETSDRLAELELYLDVVKSLYAALANARLRSTALLALRDNLDTLIRDPNFQSLYDELPTLRAPLENIGSITVGVNLDMQLRPKSAVLLGVHPHSFDEPQSLLDRLIGGRTSPDDESGVAPLHQFPADVDLRPMDALFQDVDRLMTAVAQPLARALARYVRVTSKPLVALEQELAFFVFTAAMTRRLQAKGIVFCQPQISPASERVTHIEGLVNILLALRLPGTPVRSTANFGDEGRIAVLTGPNSGGKTTYLRAVGLAHVLFQAGLYIPAAHAIMSPVDHLLTHFPALETQQQGRLAEEAERLRGVLTHATAYSLVLLNETFSSTSAGEAQYLAQDVLSALCAIGVRAIFATHLTDLAERIDEIEGALRDYQGDAASADTKDSVSSGHGIRARSSVFSLVAGMRVNGSDLAVPTYEIRRGKPLGRSYAQEIARRYGISLDQLVTHLKGRASNDL